MNYRHYGLWNIQDIIFIIIIMYQSVKKKSVFEKYFSNTPKYANQIQIQIQIFHLVDSQIQIQIQIQIFAYLNTNTNTYLTPALFILQCQTHGQPGIWWSPGPGPAEILGNQAHFLILVRVNIKVKSVMVSWLSHREHFWVFAGPSLNLAWFSWF